MSRHKTNPAVQSHGGVLVGSSAHQILLALRPAGAYLEQMQARFGQTASHHLVRLRQLGLVTDVPGRELMTLTETGRGLVSPDGPLARAKTLINYP